MVKAWKERVVIPTYEVGDYEKNPIFLEKRVYQGSSGVVYPYPVIEKIADSPTDHEWEAVYLENEYIKVMILPELGGRVQMAYDKIKERHFVYYNHVIKPALVGLAGPWISGGIEFNWPQHHRPSTYMAVDSTIKENADGSVTVWVNEMERMFHQRGQAGFTLRPGCAYLEIQGVLYNRTDVPQTFLWWANPAVSVNDYYQSVFPPDINAVFDHGKRAVSTFPIATGTYYKVDYSAGVDISNYKNIPVPTSYMGVNSGYDFEGGYENDSHGGMLHVASHHVSPGKKQWTWGNGDFGRAWDRNLTDTDGPYIELMAGVYTENQPDFSWIQPYEEKSFTQYFMPYREVGIVKQASRDFIMNVDQAEQGIRLRILATSAHDVTLHITEGSRTITERRLSLSPESVFDETIWLDGAQMEDIRIEIAGDRYDVRGIAWQAEPDELRRVPDAAEAALPPLETKTVEQLYLTGLHLEQYRHATWSPVDYYEEGLRRDPQDVRCNNALGLWYIRKGRFDKAEPYLERAVSVIKKRNPNPYEGEPIYNLGLTQKYLGKLRHAYDNFQKAAWNGALQGQAYTECAKISIATNHLEDALYETERAMRVGQHNHKARFLRAIALRKVGKRDEALTLVAESLDADLFNYGCQNEKYILTGDTAVRDQMAELMHGMALNYHELALDYAQAGCWTECIDILDMAIERGATVYHTHQSPLTYYYKGWALVNKGAMDEAEKAFDEGERTDSRCCFPNRTEDIMALRMATKIMKSSPRANYYLGCLYYDKRQYDMAKAHWEAAAEQDGKFPTTWRCLALTAYNKEHDAAKALERMERAFHLDESDSRILMELDQLYKVTQRKPAERLAFLQHYPTLIAERDDLTLEEITLLNQTGAYAEAKKKLDAHKFHPWEGGEGKVPAQYQFARVEMAKQAMAEKNPDHAIELLTECLSYPHHLGEGKLAGAQDNDFYYLMGCAYSQKGDKGRARECWTHATEGPMEPAAAMYYNDAKPDKIFYAGLAWRKLGDEARANGVFHRLISYGEKHIWDAVRMDYFAVSLPDLLIWDGDLQKANELHCKLMMGLGHMGLGNREKGMRLLDEVRKSNCNNQVVDATMTL